MKQIPQWCCNCKHGEFVGRESLGTCAMKDGMGLKMRVWVNDGKRCVDFVWADLRIDKESKTNEI
jgi:hypothetical protein